MVFPENPSGRIKTGKLPVNRRVCDGVYLFPQYFGMTSYSIPIAQKPDCSAWSFSVTKVFNAAARAGVVLYKTAEADMASAVGTIASDLSSFSPFCRKVAEAGALPYIIAAMNSIKDDPHPRYLILQEVAVFTLWQLVGTLNKLFRND